MITVLQSLTENHERSPLASVQYADSLIRDCDELMRIESELGSNAVFGESARSAPAGL